MLFDIVGDGTGSTSAEIVGTAGTETLNLLGKFDFNVSAADETVGTTWQVVGTDIENVTYDAAFTVDGATSGGGAAGSRVWTFAASADNMLFQFSESSGKLEVLFDPHAAGTVLIIR